MLAQTKSVTQNAPGQRVFRLPPEHGAVVAFGSASVLALALSESRVLTALSLLCLWAILAVLHTRKLKYVFSALGFVAFILVQQILIAFACLTLANGRAILSCSGKIQTDLKQLFGLIGMSMLPLCTCVIRAEQLASLFCASALFLHGIMFSVAVVFYYLPHKHAKCWMPFALSVVTVGAVGFFRPTLAAAVLALCAGQTIFLTTLNRSPSLKFLGLVESVYLILLTVTVSLKV